MRAGQVLRDPTSATIKRNVATDTLKIDRSFMMDLVDGPEGFALVSTIITLAHSIWVYNKNLEFETEMSRYGEEKKKT